MRRALPLLVVLLVLGLPQPALAQAPVRPDPPTAAPDSLATFGYGDTSLRGTYGTADVFVPLPPGTTARSATVRLYLEASTLLEGHSSFTLQAGGVDVQSVRLIGSQPQVELTATIPAERIGEDGLALGYRGYLRLTDDDCEEADNPGQWLTVLDHSTVTFDLARTSPVLADVPDLLSGPPGDGVVGLAVPEGADGAVLQSAVTAAWQVGRWRGAAGATPLITTSLGDLDAHAPVIAVGTTAQLADLDIDQDGVDAARAAAEGERSALAVTNGTRPTVIATGAADADVASAVDALRTSAVLASLTTDAGALTGATAVAAPATAAPWTTSSTTFAQLGIPRLTATGTGVRELFAQIDRPVGWAVTGDVVIALDVDASAALRRPTSTIQLLVNGQDAGTRSLRPAEGIARYEFTVPAGLADRTLDGRPVRTLDLVIRMVLDLPEAVCSAPEVAAAQASVLPTSTLEVPHEDASGLELARFPAPLTGEGGSGSVALVVPDGELGEETLEAALQVAAAVGRWAPADGLPPVVRRVGEVGEDGTTGTIAIGAAAEQLAGAELPDERPPSAAPIQATLALTDALEGGTPTLLLLGEGQGPLLAAQALADRATVGLLDGDVVVVQSDTAVTLRDRAAGAPPPELAPPAEPWFRQDADYLVPAVIVGAALLAMLGLVVAVRWRPMARTRPTTATP